MSIFPLVGIWQVFHEFILLTAGPILSWGFPRSKKSNPYLLFGRTSQGVGVGFFCPNSMCSFSVRSRLLRNSTIVSVADAVKSTWLSSLDEPLNTEVVASEETQPSLWKAVFWGLMFWELYTRVASPP